MGKAMGCPRRLVRRKFRAAISAVICLALLFFLAGAADALDPNKRISQYVHTSWRVQDGSNGGYAITQTTDGLLWFVTGDMRNFDGVNFTSWDGPPNGGSITKGAPFGQIVNAF